MKIAVDARPLASPLTGIGRYTHALISRLIETQHEWYLYSDRPITAMLPKQDNLHFRSGNASGGTPGSLRWAQWQFSKWAKKDEADVFWSPRHHLPLFLPERVRSVVTIHDVVWRRHPKTMQAKNYLIERLLMGPSIRQADKVICVSEFTLSEINLFYPQQTKKCSVIYEAADVLDVTENVLPKHIMPPYLLFVGTLEPRKNLARLLKSFACLDMRAAPTLVIVGSKGWGNLNIEALAKELNIAKNIILTGYVEDEELHTLYENALCLIMPSLYEGFGLPALEAMQYGTPVIYSSNTSLEEVVGQGGIAVDANSTESIKVAIESICNESTRTRLSRSALNQIKKFSWAEAADKTLRVLENC